MLLAAAVLGGTFAWPAAESDEAGARVARGRYLAEGVGRCFWCHATLNDADPAVPRPGTLGGGEVLDEKTPVVAPNITPDETGIGPWSDAEVVGALRGGIGRGGRRLRDDHPTAYFSVMTDDDAAAVVAYLRSLPMIRHALPRSAPAGAAHETVQPRVAPAAQSGAAGSVERGAYLVQLGECRGCHTTTTRDNRPARTLEFAGGRRFRLEKGYGLDLSPEAAFSPLHPPRADEASLVASANITSDASGIAFYTEDVFITTLRTGRVGGIRPLSSAMPWVFFRKLTDDDLRAVLRYLKALPPVRHRVSNFDPPTYCSRCGRRHGLGELN